VLDLTEFQVEQEAIGQGIRATEDIIALATLQQAKWRLEMPSSS